MELKAKYQYSYFIYPYIINEKNYAKYLLKLLKNKKFSLKIFEKERDYNIYKYFTPEAREYLFYSFELEKQGLKDFESLDVNMKATLLSKHNCNWFEYKLEQDIQGKTGQETGIFFTISKVQVVCFKNGICFLILKTNLENGENFEDILNFNYKFKDINSQLSNLKEYENIKIQASSFKDIKDISNLIYDITGKKLENKKYHLNNERFYTYTYTCLDQAYWNEKTNMELLEKEFLKYSKISPAFKQVENKVAKEELEQIYETKYRKYGISNYGSTLLTSDLYTDNYTKLPFKYENEGLYNYILCLYKYLFLSKINEEFNKKKKVERLKKNFIYFTEKLLVQQVTQDEEGKLLNKKWEEVLQIEDLYFKLKNKYDVIYKNYNMESVEKRNKILIGIIVFMLIINIINLWLIL